KRIQAAKEQYQREYEAAQSFPTLGFFLPAHTRPYYIDPTPQIRDPLLRQQSALTKQALFATSTINRNMVAIAYGATELLYAAALVAPLVIPEAGGVAAVGGGVTTAEGAGVGTTALGAAARIVGGRLVLARGALVAAGRGAWVYYLQNPILVNEMG